ncbi:MAG TPA: hypothetical protein VI670_27755 [Thermoanaerobaculia bacterium]|jgi:hypothetical protein
MPRTAKLLNSQKLAHNAGSRESVKIDRRDLLDAINLTVKGEVNVSVAGTVVTQGVLAYIQAITVYLGTVPIIGPLTGRDIYEYLKVFHRQAPVVTDPGSGTGVKPFSVTVKLPFASLHAFQAILTALPAWAYPEITLEVQYGALSDLYTGGTATLQNLAAIVSLDALKPSPDESAKLLGDPGMYAVHRITAKQKQVAVSEDHFVIPLSRGAGKRGLLIRSTDAGVLSDAIITEFSVIKDGNPETFRQDWTRLKEQDQAVYELAMSTGVAVLDYAEDRDIVNILDARSADQLDFDAKVVIGGGTTLVRIVEDDLLPSGL